jgi:peptide/nickel transport system substrate-binding protein
MISNWWKQIGVESTPQLVDVGSLADEQAAWKHDTYIWVWGAGGLDPDFNLKVLIGSQAKPAPNLGLNDCGMMNATYDALYDQQMQETDLVKRRDIVWRMQDIVHQEAAYIPLYTPMAIQAFRNDRFTSIPPGKIPPLAQSSVTKDFVINMRPIVARPTTTATTVTAPYGMGPETLGIVVVLVVVVVAVAFFATKRKKAGA